MLANLASGAGAPPGAAATATAAVCEIPKNINLLDEKNLLDKSECYARNEHPNFPWTNLMIGDPRIGCKSDADEQLIIHLEFSDFVKVHSIKLTEFNNGIEPECNPTLVKLFVNRNNLGFEDIDDVDPTTILELSTEDLKESADPMLVQYVLYQRVKSVTMYIEDNNGGEFSALGALKVFGKPVATTNMKDFKKQG